MFVDNSACNLASLNLMKFIDDDGAFDVKRFRHAVRLFIIAQDILVDSASYPTDEIAQNSHLFRPLGLGLRQPRRRAHEPGLALRQRRGPRLRRRGHGADDRLRLRDLGGSCRRVAGPFHEYEKNRDSMLNVIRMHADALQHIDSELLPAPTCARPPGKSGRSVQRDGARSGFRNAQVTLLAPTGTIGFMMDCDTTGVEPDIALVKYKQLAGGGMMKIVNRTRRPACAGWATTARSTASCKYVDEAGHDRRARRA